MKLSIITTIAISMLSKHAIAAPPPSSHPPASPPKPSHPPPPKSSESITIPAAPVTLAPEPPQPVTAVPPPKVLIKNGTLVGAYDKEFDLEAFLGIPYAEPPTGENRFYPPKPIRSTWRTKTVTKFGPSCFWTGSKGVHDHDGIPSNEDCLTINVIRPRERNRKLPVFVWLYGGSFQHGTAARDLYNLKYPVNQSVVGGVPAIGVSFNFRTNGFGFLASNGEQGSANNGLRDQRMALQWIQENIAAFGGDPGKVTVWGGSSGAISIAHHMFAYNGRDDHLFHQAILSSGFPGTISLGTFSTAQKQYSETIKQAGCANNKDTFKCLQDMKADKLSKLFNDTGINYVPIIDGEMLTDHPDNLYKSNKFVAVPAIAGNTEDEGTFPIISLGEVDNFDDIVQNLTSRYPNLDSGIAKKVAESYPDDVTQGAPFGTGYEWATDFGGQWKRGNAIGGDIAIHAPRRRFVNELVHRGKDVYSYMWNQTNQGIEPQLGATHMTDLVYAMANPSKLTQSRAAIIGEDDADHHKWKLAELSSRFFMSFVATGNPNKAKIGNSHLMWPKYEKDTQRMYYFNANGNRLIADTYRSDAIDYINRNVEQFQVKA